jgi:hypothetical protein
LRLIFEYRQKETAQLTLSRFGRIPIFGCFGLGRLGFGKRDFPFPYDFCESVLTEGTSSDMGFFAVIGVDKTKTLANKDVWVFESENVVSADSLGNFFGPFCHGAVWNEPSEVYSHCLSFDDDCERAAGGTFYSKQPGEANYRIGGSIE